MIGDRIIQTIPRSAQRRKRSWSERLFSPRPWARPQFGHGRGSPRRWWVVVAAVVAVCCCGSAALTGLLGAVADRAQQPELVACHPALGDAEPAAAAGLDALDDEQRTNGTLIVEVGVELGTPPRAWVIAVATALQESGLRNLPHQGDRNDHDSVGLFQQRPSQGWGTAAQLQDPRYATTAFYQRLLQVPGWQDLPLTEAADAVQRSAHPDAYARHEPLAVALVSSVAGGAGAAAGFASDVRCALPGEVTAAGWTAPAEGPVWSGFRPAARPDHFGVDIGAPRAAPVVAAADGVVTLITCNASVDGRPYSCDLDGGPSVAGCGWYLDLRHGDVVTRYCHLLARPELAVGDQVRAGQPVGLVGSSGHSSGPHLHFEVELQEVVGQGDGGVEVRRTWTDPVAFLALRGVTLECPGRPADCDPAHGDRVLTGTR